MLCQSMLYALFVRLVVVVVGNDVPVATIMNVCASKCNSSGNCSLNEDILLGSSKCCSIESTGYLLITSKITCVTDSDPYRFGDDNTSCTISLSFDTGITLSPGALLRASTVSMKSTAGQIVISRGADIIADGLGLCYYASASPGAFEGTMQQSGDDFSGAGHGGFGGSCSDAGGGFLLGKPYGDGTAPLSAPSQWRRSFALDHYGSVSGHVEHGMLPSSKPRPQANAFGYLLRQGVQSVRNKGSCCGGGAVIIEAFSVQLDGQVISSTSRHFDHQYVTRLHHFIALFVTSL